MIDCNAVTQRLSESLAGRRVLITGATGFVGEALLERLLFDVPDVEVVLIVRSRGFATAQQRVEELLAKPAFDRLRQREGDDVATRLLSEQLAVLDGDLAHVPDLPGDIDIVVHCAGEVSFDPAIDEGFATNLHGTLSLLAAIEASGSTPHYVHVSTAYVAGRRQGLVPEGRLDHSIDWRTEAAQAELIRERVETDSRTATQLAEFLAAAEREHSSVGASTVAADAERRRVEWMGEQLVAAGRERARTLGWTDCYTFTKAMAERAVEEATTQLPVTILRPSIIESALAQPYPGWIEGFKMAEPLILAYGRGDLPDFPGIPDGTIDVIPVDFVINATLAAMARRPEPGTPSYFTICSGARNPLTFHVLYQLVRDYFLANPLVQRDRGAVRVPSWNWPGSARVDQLLTLGTRAHRTADRVVSSLPRSDRSRGWARSLDRRKRQLDFLRRYFDLYRPYADAELTFVDDQTLALHRSLHPDDVERFGFDAIDIDWSYYLVDVHVPTVVEPLRMLTASRTPRPDPVRSVVEGGDVVAVFDMDGTLLPSNVVESYLWLRLPELSTGAAARELADVARSLPQWLITQRRDRSSFLRQVYRRYAGALPDDLDRLVDEDITTTVLARLSPAAVRAVREHRAKRHRVVLVTGAVTPLTRPIAPLFDEIVCAELEVGADGRYNGHLLRPPLVGESRGAWLRHRAGEAGWDLPASYAYADSASDLPLLRAVGNPVAVDPDVVLSRVARKERWPVEMWHGRAPVGRNLATVAQ